MAEREQILADFQACTGIENLEECIVILEQHDWNLMAAVKNAIEPSLMGPNHSDEHLPVQSTDTYHPSFNDLLSSQRVAMYTDSGGGGSSSGIPEAAMPVASHIPSTSQVFGGAQARFLNFSVEYRDRTIPLVVKDTERVVRIKELLQSTLDLPVSKMQLSGWVNKYDNGVADDDLLRMLHLPKENTLFLLTPDVSQPTVNLAHNGDLNPEDIERLSKMFTLNIRDKDKDKLYQLHYPGSLTIQEVKADVFAVTDVPVRHQLWTGWPEAARDETMTLAGSGVTFPSHNFEVCHRPVTPVEPRQEEDMDAEYNMLTVDAEASDEDFEDAHESFGVEEDMFESDAGSTQTHKQQPLMPPDCDDQTKALEHFVREFSTRYGDCHPIFYIGRLEDAITDALQCRARERKLLAVYLHHDDSILANVFCSQILCSETVVDYLSSNFITWAWDLTSEANKARLLTLCTRYFGSIAANTVRNFKADELPLLLIFSRSRRTNEVVDVVHGNTTLDELMTHLIRAVDLFNQQQIAEIAEEDERNARESVKREQDDAYQLSLAADRAKAEAKRRGEEERRKQVEDEARKNELIEEKRREAEAEKEAIRQSIQDQLPPEPPENCKQPLSNIRLRCPGGEMFTRRFLATTRLQVLLNFVTVKGFDTANYKVLTTFPRRDLTQLDSQETLEKLKIYPQETLILEEK